MKAIGLFSGGLDSILAGKLITLQKIDVIMLCFCTPFFPCPKEKKQRLSRVCNQIGAKLKIIDITSDYIKMLSKPKYGYGKNLNPCIDCKILMLKKAKTYAKKIDAKFIFTGEVAGQRPMSQNRSTLNQILNQTKLKGKLLRPLSAKLLLETEAELKGWVDRNKLLEIHGRGRKKQIALAKKWKIKGYQSPAGGCLLTCENYCRKVTDLFKHQKQNLVQDIKLLQIGRHFRLNNNNKIIVGRNENDNKKILALNNKKGLFFEVPGHGSPVTILFGKKTAKAIRLAAELTARYSSCKDSEILVKYGKDKLNSQIIVKNIKYNELDKYRI